MKLAALFSVLAIGLLVGCPINDEVLRSRIETELHAKLAVGDSCEKIEQVLKEEKLQFDFDEFLPGYQAGFRPKETRMVERVITVLIYIDSAKKLSKIEVRNSYTFL